MQEIRNIFTLALVVGLLFALTTPSCTHDPFLVNPIDTMDTIMPPDTSEVCHPDSIYFRKDVLPIVLSSCGMGLCHDSESKQGGVEITSYGTLIASGIVEPFDPNGSLMYIRMAGMAPPLVMPPSPRGPISDTNILVIRRWIEQGALNLDCPDDTTCVINAPVSFEFDVFPVIDKYCKGCHSGKNPWAGLFLRDYEEVKVIADSGKLVGVISHDTGFPQMPMNQSRLLQCDIDKIRMWVDEGAPDN
jgi:hypothetical protein